MSKEIATVAIDHMAIKYLDYIQKRQTILALQDQVAKLEEELREAVGDNEVATIFGEPVITYRFINRYQAKQLETDNPVLFKQYVNPKVVDVFDAEAFAADHPNLARQYQSRQWKAKEVK